MDYLKILLKWVSPQRYYNGLKQTYRRLRYIDRQMDPYSALSRFYFRLKYRGERVICPVCGGRFREFIPYGYKEKRANVMCPVCGSFERHRLLWLYLKNRTNLFSDRLKCLHFSPEYIIQKKFKAMRNLDYTSADPYLPSAMVRMDITNIPYKDNTFDVVLATHVLQCVADDRKAIREIFRVLKPAGWAIIQSAIDLGRPTTFEDPSIISPEDRASIYGNPDVVRVYGRDYKDRLEEAGFVVNIDGYARELGAEAVEKYALQDDEDIYFCTKPL